MKSKFTFSFFFKIVVAISALILGSYQNSYSQFWIQKAGGVTIDEAYDISTAGLSESYTVGYFTGNATFGSVPLTSSGSTDMFITKHDAQGNLLWAVKAGGSGSDRGLSIKTDNQGNSYVTGYFNGSATFGSTTITSAGLQDIFVAKYNGLGVFQWVTQAGGTGSDIGFGVSFNSSNEVFITGSFKGTAIFGSTTLTATNTTSDVFIAKLNSNGVFQWAHSGTGNYTNKGVDINCDSLGNVYVTGMFSDTITFGSTHPNQAQNVIFVIKYNNSGSELWFRIVGGGITNAVHSIAVDNVGLCWITGDFTGSLTFYGTPNVTLTNPYPNKIFVAKYSSSGTIIWTHADGSDNAITSRSINLNNTGSCWITGFFSCKFSEYADAYGQGTFNAVGGSDVFATKLHSSGNWAYSRSMGGRGEDKAFGIAVSSGNQIHLAGSFNNNLYVRTSTNFFTANLALWNDVSCTGNTPYCQDFEYGQYHSVPSSGNLDAFMGKCIDKNREPFDFYKRSGIVSDCAKPQTDVCINANCPDTVTACGAAILSPVSQYCSNIGPESTYSWSPGTVPIAGSPNVTVSTSGTYFVTQTSVDGCYTSVDSIYANILVSSDTVTISDDHGFNTNSSPTTPIDACSPDTVVVWGSGFNTSNSYWWTGDNLPQGGLFDSTFSTSSNGFYVFHWISDVGCEDSLEVLVTFHDVLDPFPLKLFMEDSASICEGENFIAQLYDSINNPSITANCIVIPNVSIIATWTITPITSQNSSCGTFGFFFPDTSGWYQISVEFIRINFCYADTIVLSDSIYINVNPSPVVPTYSITITGGPNLCPGDTLALEASGAPNYTWVGPNVNGVTDSIIYVYTPGNYLVGSIVYDTNSFGCVSSFDTITSVTIVLKAQPIVTSASAVICPGDSVQLTSNALIGNNWEGPNGPISNTSSIIYVSDPGLYYTIVNDADSCGLVSNSILLTQYTTPQLVATGDTILCDGDSTTITVQTDTSAIIDWQPPLSGSNLTQVIYTAGTYTVKITSCGIETFASITIHPASALASITPSGILCEDSTIILSATPNMASYLWMPGGQTTPTITANSSGIFTVQVVDSNGCTDVSDTLILDQIFVNATITSTAQGFCWGDSLSLMGNPGMVTYQWVPTGETTQNIVTSNPGTFTLIVTDTNGCTGVSDDAVIVVPDSVASINLLGSDYFCEGDSVVLDAESPIISSYNWFPGNEQTPSITVTQTGTYAVATLDTFGCNAYSDTVNITVDKNTLLIPNVSNDTAICSGTSIVLNASVDSGNLVWYNPLDSLPVFTGSHYQVFVINDTRFYVRSETEVCVSEPNSVLIETFNCEGVIVPNVFTPNGDGVNDYFQIQVFGASYFKVEIFNRWGTLIYTLDHPNQRWDGTMYESGETLPDGTYYYVLTYGKYDGTDASQKGYVSLMR